MFDLFLPLKKQTTRMERTPSVARLRHMASRMRTAWELLEGEDGGCCSCGEGSEVLMS